MPVAWLCIDERGDDLRSFITHLIAALRTVRPGIGRQTLDLLNLPSPSSPAGLAATLNNELIECGELVLTLDDYHLISDADVHEFVGALVDRSPPGFHLIVATRADPPLPLARLRARGQLTELRAANLRFTSDETAAFFERSAGLALDAPTLALIEERADGWAAGLRLAALSLQENAAPETALAAFEGRRFSGLMEYVVDEVLAAQPEDVQRVLLRTSIVERICAPLAVALLDDGTSAAAAEDLLDQITRANLYLSPLEAGPNWRRYHALFRDALRTRLGVREGDHGVAALHRRASAWLAANGLIDEALYHARAAGDDEAAALIVEQQIHPALDRDDIPTLESWMKLLSPEMLERRPALILGRSWVAYVRGRHKLHGLLVTKAQASLDSGLCALDATTVAALRGEVEVGQSFRLLDAGDIAGADEAVRRALALLPSDHRYVMSLALTQQAFVDLLNWRGAAIIQRVQAFLDTYDRTPDLVFVRMLVTLMRMHAYLGNLAEARQAATDALALASDLGLRSSMSGAHHQLGAIAYQMNDLDTAESHLRAVVTDAVHSRATFLRDSAFGLALAQRARGCEPEARRTLDELQHSLRQSANTEQLALLRTLQNVFSSEPAVAETHAPIAHGAWRPTQVIALIGSPDLVHIEVLLRLATGESLAEAEILLDDLLHHARSLRFVSAEIELLTLQCVLAQTQGRHDAAVEWLERALDLAAQKGFVRVYVDRGPLLAAVLRSLQPRSRHGATIDRLLAAFAAEPAERAAQDVPTPLRPAPLGSSVDALTDREIQILERLAARLSYKEIADELVISPFTVKAHASNIYGKLGVAGRRQAIQSARALGVLA